MSDRWRVVAALVLGLVVGGAISTTGSAWGLQAVSVVAPIGSLWVKAIQMTVIPLVMALLVTGVAEAKQSIGRIGVRALVTFLALLLGTAAVMVPLEAFAFSRFPGGVAGAAAFPAEAVQAAGSLARGGKAAGLSDWIASLLPANPVAAAADGALLPLVLFTLIAALAISRLPEAERDALLNVARGVKDAMLVVVGWVVAAAPIGVFALVLPLAAKGGGAVAGRFVLYVVIYSAACLLATALLYLVVAMWMPVRRFARAALPAQLVGFASSSSLAALPAMLDGVERELAMPEEVAGFVLPLAVTTFKIGAPVAWPIGALFVAKLAGTPLTAPQLAIVTAASIGAIAVPGVPRGAFLMLTPVFLMLGLPAAGVGLLIALDAIPDLFATVLNVTGDLAAAAIVAQAPLQPASGLGTPHRSRRPDS